MILLEENKPLITDLPFSCATFSGFEIPYFISPEEYHDVIIDNSSNINPFWWSIIRRPSVYVKIHGSLVPLGCVAQLNVVNSNGLIVNTLPFTVFTLPNGWKCLWRHNIPVLTHTISDKFRFEISINGVVLANAPVRQEYMQNMDKYLNFNFYNTSGDVAGFPFSYFGGLGSNGITVSVEGGINIGNTRNLIEQETFRDQRFNTHTLAAHPRSTAILTIGSAKGVPEYVGELINSILCCDTVFLNGKRICRSQNSAPEPTNITKGYPFVNYTIEIEYVQTESNIYDIATCLNL